MQGSAVSRRLALAGAVLAVLPGAAPLASLDVGVAGLRSTRGLIQVCVTADPAHFPGCDKDPTARRLTIAAARGGELRFDDMPTGGYAVAIVHDENGNGKLDTRFGIPVEGVGFSNNPRLFFGPPSFRAARIAVDQRPTDETVRIKYFL